jgi:Transposase DDE domain
MVLTTGQRSDSPQFVTVLEKIRVARLGGGRPRTRPDRVLADKAYTSKANRSLATRYDSLAAHFLTRKPPRQRLHSA